MVRETVSYLHDMIRSGKKTILVEGAQSTILDIDFGKNEKRFLYWITPTPPSHPCELCLYSEH